MPFDPTTAKPASKGFDPTTALSGPYRPTGPLPGEPGYVQPQSVTKPQGIGQQILTQGGRYTPGTAKSMLAGDVETLLDSQMGLAAVEPAVGKQLAKVGAPLGKAGQIVAETPAAVGKGLAHVIGGIGTHTGGEPIIQAAKAGYAGGEKSKVFLDALREKSSPEELVVAAKDALSSMRQERNAAYRSGMIDVTKDSTLLDFKGIDDALIKMKDVAFYEGKVVNQDAASTLGKIQEAVAEWKNGDPAVFHTVEGMDALKQRVGAILEQATPHTKAHVVATDAYRAIRDTISDQAPTYGKVMGEYEKATDAIREIESGLSLKSRSSVDQGLRKLQSVMRNNANTNYGNRLRLLATLDKSAGGMLAPRVAGQALSSLTPRGLGNLEAGLTGIYGASHPAALAALPVQSPRAVGEAAHFAGKSARAVADALGVSKKTAKDILERLGVGP